MKTKAGKNMPVDWDARYVDDTEFSMPAGHISHFGNCKFADQHRGPKIISADDEETLKRELDKTFEKHHGDEIPYQKEIFDNDF
jgi:hypothetical protein